MGRSGGYPGSTPPRGIKLAGGLLLVALLPLPFYPSLTGPYIFPFLLSFCAAGLAYVLALARLPREFPALRLVWGFALLFRLVMLLTPVSLSDDVYRYVWDGHLLNSGANPYFAPVNSPLLDAYDTALRARVNFAWMATPYLPAAQAYFALVERLAPQNPFAFQAGAALLDLAAGGLLLLTLRQLRIPDKAILVYLWNPLVIVEFAHGAHVDALMLFFVTAALWSALRAERGSLALSALALAGGVLVKGWPALLAPLLAARWGFWRSLLFGLAVLLPLVLFANGAGWGLAGPLDGRGVFGAVRIYTRDWEFNSGLYTWLARLLSADTARLLSLVIPAAASLWLGWQALRERRPQPGRKSTREDSLHAPEHGQEPLTGVPVQDSTNHSLPGSPGDPFAADRRLVRLAVLPFGLYLLLSPTIHPWYLGPVLALLTFFWPAPGESVSIRRWLWPGVYFMFFAGFTYLAYGGISRPGGDGLVLISTAGYLPLWALLVWAGWHRAASRA